MKYSKLLCIVFTVLIIMPVYSKNSIHLSGRWSDSQRTIVNELPIHAWIEHNNKELSLLFNDDLGTIYITILDFSGNILYDQVVDTKIIYSFIIPIKDMKGEYILSITNSKNKIFGQFFIY